jgi:hypothetical protein
VAPITSSHIGIFGLQAAVLLAKKAIYVDCVWLSSTVDPPSTVPARVLAAGGVGRFGQLGRRPKSKRSQRARRVRN